MSVCCQSKTTSDGTCDGGSRCFYGYGAVKTQEANKFKIAFDSSDQLEALGALYGLHVQSGGGAGRDGLRIIASSV